MVNIIDSAGVRIEPVTEGFAAQLRADVQAAIEEATAGADKTIHINIDVDSDAAEARLRESMNRFGNDGTKTFTDLKTAENELFDDIGRNAEKSRIKQTAEQTKLRDKLKQVWAPATQRLKLEQNQERIGWDKVTAAAKRAADASAAAFGGKGNDNAIKAEAALTKARQEAEAAANQLGAAEERLGALRQTAETRNRRLVEAENALQAARDNEREAVFDIGLLERQLEETRRDSEATAKEIREAERALAQGRKEAEQAAKATEKAENDLNRARELSANADERVVAAENRIADSRNKVADSSRKTEKAERDLAEADRTVAIAHDEVSAAAHRLGLSTDRYREIAERSFEVSNRHVEVLRREAGAHDDTARSVDHHAQAYSRLIPQVSGARRALNFARNDFSNLGREIDRGGNLLTRFGGHLQNAGRRTTLFGRSTTIAGKALDGVGNIMTGVTGLFRGFSGLLTGAAGASDILKGALGNLGQGLSGVAEAALKAVGMIVQLGVQFAIYATIAGAVTFAIGALATAIAGLPALIGAAGASFAVFALGMDGIKKAYNEGLKPALDGLKRQVSDVFEQGLKPQMQQLAQTLIPAVTGNLKVLAQAWVDVSGRIVNVITSAQGLNQIKSIIDNTTQAVRDSLGPALENLVVQFLNVAAQGAILQGMIGIISDITNNVANWLNEMNRLDIINPAVQALRHGLDAAEKAILNVATGAIQFFTNAEPGFANLATSIGNIARQILPALGEAFGTAMQAASELLDSIPPGVWQAVTDAVKRLADKLLEMARDPAVQQFAGVVVSAIAVVIDAFTSLLGFIQTVIGAFQDVAEALGLLPPPARLTNDEFNNLLTGTGYVVDGMGRVVPAADNAAGALGGVGSAAGQIPGQVQPPMDQTARTIEDSMRRAQDAARNGGQGVADGVTTPLPAMQQTTQVSFDTLPPVVQNAMVGATAAAQTGSDLVKNAVETGFNNAANAAQIATGRINTETTTAFTTMQTSVSTAMTGTQTAVETASTAMSTAVSTMATSVTTNSANAGEAMAKLGQDALAMQTNVTGAFDQVGAAADGLRAKIVADFQQAGQAATELATTVQTAMTNMRTAVETALTGISTSFTTTFTNVKTVVTDSMNQVTTTIQTSMDKAKQTIQQALQQIVQNFQQAGQQMVQLTQQAWQQINAAIQAGGQKAVEQCRQIAQQILQVFKDLAPQLQAAGNTMMDRLAAGIIAGGARAVAAAQQVAARIKAQFPASPAKEGPLSGRGDPLRSGGVIMQRLAQGIFDNGHVVRSALSPILNDFRSVLAAVGNSAAIRNPLSGWSITSGPADAAPTVARVLDVPLQQMAFSGNVVQSNAKPGGWNASNGGILAEDGSYVNPNFYDKRPRGSSASDIREALEGMTIRFDDSGNGLAKLVNKQNRSLARR